MKYLKKYKLFESVEYEDDALKELYEDMVDEIQDVCQDLSNISITFELHLDDVHIRIYKEDIASDSFGYADSQYILPKLNKIVSVINEYIGGANLHFKISGVLYEYPKCFNNLRSLVDLDLTFNNIKEIDGISNPYLTDLSIGHNSNLSKISNINLPKLENIRFPNTNIKDLSFIKELPKLNNIVAVNCGFDKNDILIKYPFIKGIRLWV